MHLSPRRLLAIVWLTLCLPVAHAGTWQLVGPPIEGRNYPIATLLPDGTVLVTGGIGAGDAILRSAERFDPSIGTFSALPPMTAPRFWHAVVRLSDGRVLLAGGGKQDRQAQNTAELFDPKTGTFAATGAMAVPRFAATATLLRDGRVLVVGGQGGQFGGGLTATAEIYDPATGRFQPTGSLSLARAGHHAFLLPDGRVAILGGFGAQKSARLVEIYDPANGRFGTGGELIGERDIFASATMLADGRILLAGGEASNPSGNKVTDRSIEIYDPATGKSTVIGVMNEAREEHVAALLPDGRVLVAGGWAVAGTIDRARRTAELIDPATGHATLVEPMAATRANAASLLLPDGRVLAVGGLHPGGLRKTAEVYVP